MKNKTLKLLLVLMVLVMAVSVFAACGEKTDDPVETDPTAAPEETEEAETAEPEVTPEPVPVEPGANLKSITFIGVDIPSAVTQLEADAIDIFGGSLPGEYLTEIQDADLTYVSSTGLNYEIMTNNAVTDAGFNPFSIREFREAMNRFVDRDYICSEIFGGAAVPRIFPIGSVAPDYARYIDYARAVEANYTYDKDAAVAVMDAALTEAGVEKVDGKYTYEGEAISLTFLIRSDDNSRTQIGDYISNELESIGFTVDRQYKTSPECYALWGLTEPTEGQWHLYTGAWGASGLARDSAIYFHDFTSPDSRYGYMPWTTFVVDEEDNKVLEDLANSNFGTMDERAALFEKAFAIDAYYAQRIWIADGLAYTPWNENISTSYNLSAGVDGSNMTAYTLKDSGDGEIVWGNQQAPLINPVNPVAGTNWTYDAQYINFTQDYGFIGDPFTGLQYPKRAEKADVIVQSGLPVSQTYDWVNLSFEDEIVVPEDAMVDWDVASETWVLQGSEEVATAKMKTVYYYSEDLGDYTWHDGTSIKLADIMMAMITGYSMAYEDSPLYDESVAASFLAGLEYFKGWKIVSEDPIVIEYYTDSYGLDAENNVSDLTIGWTYDSTGAQASWYAVAAGNDVVLDGLATWSEIASAENDAVEWLNYLDGPCVEYLADSFTELAESSYIPYEATMGNYVTAEEAKASYEAALAFYEANGHFFIGCGPYYVSNVMSTEGSITLTAYDDYKEDRHRWDFLSTPKIASIELDGPASVSADADAVFEVYVDDPNGDAYPADEITAVKYLLYDSTGAIADVVEVEATEDGLYEIVLSADTIAELGSGACKLEVVVSPKAVAAPSIVPAEFVVD